jgi:hypothetical protein
MQRVVVTVKKKDEARVRDLEVPADMDAVRLAQQIARALGWSSDRAGQPLTYQIEAHPLGRMLQPGESLASAGVWDGSWLVLHPDVVETPPTAKPAPVETPQPVESKPVATTPAPPVPAADTLPEQAEPAATKAPILEATPATRPAKTPTPIEVSKTTPEAETEAAIEASAPVIAEPSQVLGSEVASEEALANTSAQLSLEDLAVSEALPAETLLPQEPLAPADAVETSSVSTPQPAASAQAQIGETLPTGETTPEATPGVEIETPVWEPEWLAEATPVDVTTPEAPLIDETPDLQPLSSIATPSWVTEAEPVSEAASTEEPPVFSQAPTASEVEADDDSWLRAFLEKTSPTEPPIEAAQSEPGVSAPMMLEDLLVPSEPADTSEPPADAGIPSTFEEPTELETSFANEAQTVSDLTPTPHTLLMPNQATPPAEMQPIAQAAPQATPIQTPTPAPPKQSELASPGAGPVAGWRKVVDLAPGSEPSQAEEKPQSRFVWKQLDEE